MLDIKSAITNAVSMFLVLLFCDDHIVKVGISWDLAASLPGKCDRAARGKLGGYWLLWDMAVILIAVKIAVKSIV